MYLKEFLAMKNMTVQILRRGRNQRINSSLLLFQTHLSATVEQADQDITCATILLSCFNNPSYLGIWKTHKVYVYVFHLIFSTSHHKSYLNFDLPKVWDHRTPWLTTICCLPRCRPPCRSWSSPLDNSSKASRGHSCSYRLHKVRIIQAHLDIYGRISI